MKMTKIESARIIERLKGCSGSNIDCTYCFNLKKCDEVDYHYSGNEIIGYAAAYIKRHESKTKVKTDVRDITNVVKDETVKESLKVDPTPLEIAKAHVIKLICVDNQKGGDYLTIGKEYELLEESDFFYNVKNDKGYTGSYLKKEFTSPAEYLKDHSVDVKKVEPVGNSDKPVMPEPISIEELRKMICFKDEYVYYFNRDEKIGRVNTKHIYEMRITGKHIMMLCGTAVEAENYYKTLDEAVRVAESKWGVK